MFLLIILVLIYSNILEPTAVPAPTRKAPKQKKRKERDIDKERLEELLQKDDLDPKQSMFFPYANFQTDVYMPKV